MHDDHSTDDEQASRDAQHTRIDATLDFLELCIAKCPTAQYATVECEGWRWHVAVVNTNISPERLQAALWQMAGPLSGVHGRDEDMRHVQASPPPGE